MGNSVTKEEEPSVVNSCKNMLCPDAVVGENGGCLCGPKCRPETYTSNGKIINFCEFNEHINLRKFSNLTSVSEAVPETDCVIPYQLYKGVNIPGEVFCKVYRSYYEQRR